MIIDQPAVALQGRAAARAARAAQAGDDTVYAMQSLVDAQLKLKFSKEY